MSASQRSGSRFDQRLQHHLKIKGRAADDLEHVGGGGLLLQRLTQFVEQPGVLDGDDRLRSKVRDQLDLLVAKRSYLLAIDDDAAEQLALLEHWHQQHCPRPSAVDQGDDTRFAFDVAPFCSEIGNVNDRFRDCQMSERDARFVADDHDRFALPKLPIGRGRILHGDHAKGIVLVDKQIAELGLADAHRVFEQALEHRPKGAWRTADDLQHLGGRGLLLQRLGQFARAGPHLIEQPHVLDRDHRLVGERLDQLDLLIRERTDLQRVSTTAPTITPFAHTGQRARCEYPPSASVRTAWNSPELPRCPEYGSVRGFKYGPSEAAVLFGRDRATSAMNSSNSEWKAVMADHAENLIAVER